jgi:hypothetical protein
MNKINEEYSYEGSPDTYLRKIRIKDEKKENVSPFVDSSCSFYYVSDVCDLHTGYDSSKADKKAELRLF